MARRVHGWGVGGVHGGGMHAMYATQHILQDAVNERAVRMLLESILVSIESLYRSSSRFE